MKRPGRLIGGGGDFSNGLMYGKESNVGFIPFRYKGHYVTHKCKYYLSMQQTSVFF